MSQAAAPATPYQAYETSTLDVLKTVAVVLMIVDHVGLYLMGENAWLRILGRPAAVIFGFLIGFSRSTRVPPSWVALGLGLSLLQDRLFPDAEENGLDILISLALTRIAMPFFDRLHDIHPLWLVPTGVGLTLLSEPVDQHLEYGTDVMLVALVGAALRLDTGRPEHTVGRDATALVAIIGMSFIMLRHFEFVGLQAAACVAILAVTIVALSRFRRHRIRVPAVVAPLLGFCGRNTLWIYAFHLAALLVYVWWTMQGAGEPES